MNLQEALPAQDGCNGEYHSRGINIAQRLSGRKQLLWTILCDRLQIWEALQNLETINEEVSICPFDDIKKDRQKI